MLCVYSWEAPHRGASHEYPQLIFVKKLEKYRYFLVEKCALSRLMNNFILFLFLHENIIS